MGVLRVVEHGLLYGAVPCSSFVFMSAGSHKRSDNHPWGEERYPFVYDGNALGSRFLLLCLLAIVRNAKWMLENPRCTSLSLLPPLKYLLTKPIGGQFANWPGAELLGLLTVVKTSVSEHIRAILLLLLVLLLLPLVILVVLRVLPLLPVLLVLLLLQLLFLDLYI